MSVQFKRHTLSVGIFWAISRSCNSLFMVTFYMIGNSSSVASKAEVSWNCGLGVILWILWMERIRRIFEDSENDLIFCGRKLCFWHLLKLQFLRSSEIILGFSKALIGKLVFLVRFLGYGTWFLVVQISKKWITDIVCVPITYFNII